MDYNTLLDLAVEMGYRLAMAGAETFRVEESINKILHAYGIASEAFAIPNCLTVSIETPDGKPMTLMRRIGHHGNDLDAVEQYSNLSRRICAEHPKPKIAVQWMRQTQAACRTYCRPIFLLGDFLGAFGFALFFGGTWLDALCAGFCGVLIGCIDSALNSLHANPFFRTILEAFIMALTAYILGAMRITHNADCVIIGSLMILVPGLLFTNAMRDIIYGDTNAGINRIVQVFLIAVALALGTAAAWRVCGSIFGTPANQPPLEYGFWMQELGCLIGCLGFSILFNIHGPGGLLCALGGILSWAAYLLTIHLGGSDLAGYFWAAVFSSAFSETMARIRKYPAISYLVVSIFPLIPGASIYYTMNEAVRGNTDSFGEMGLHTIAVAGFLAVGILLISTVFRLWGVWKGKSRRAAIHCKQ